MAKTARKEWPRFGGSPFQDALESLPETETAAFRDAWLKAPELVRSESDPERFLR